MDRILALLALILMFIVPPFTQHNGRTGLAGPPPVAVPDPYLYYRSDLGVVPAGQSFTVRAAGAYTTDIYNGASFGGVTLAQNDRILYFSSPIFSDYSTDRTGIFYNGGSFSIRATDADTQAKVSAKPYVYVQEGTYAGQYFKVDLTNVDNGLEVDYTPTFSIPTWADQMVRGDLVQATAARQPAYTQLQLNGHPAVRFPGAASNGLETAVLSPNQNTPITMVGVVKMNSAADDKYLLQTHAGSSASVALLTGPAGGSTGGRLNMKGTGSVVAGSVATTTSPIIFTLQHAAGTGAILLRINGATSISSTTTLFTNFNNIRIGSAQGGGNAATMDWFLLKVWNSALSAAQYAAEESAAAVFYGLGGGSLVRTTDDGSKRITSSGDYRIVEGI